MKVFFTCILSLFFLSAFSQQTDDSLRVIKAWELQNYYSLQEPVDLDTNLPGYQVIYPVYKYSISNSFLGNYGSPAIPNIFNDRNFNHDAFFINPYMPNFYSAERNLYFDTKKPYSTLNYTNGGPSENREQALEAFHTQNINAKLNFSLRYQGLSSKGQYRYLQLKRHAFQITANYIGNRYMVHTGFNMARVRAAESGGIIDSVFQSGIINNNDVKEKDLPAVFGGTNNPDYESNA